MGLGKQIRMNRIFSHPSGNLCSVAIDHFTVYNLGLPPGLRHIRESLAAVVAGQPDAVTIHKGMAKTLWPQYAGQLPLILQTSGVRPDDSAMTNFVSVEEAVRMGADAAAVVVFVRGKTEPGYLKILSDYVDESHRYDLPIIVHVYPRDADNNIIFEPEEIAWAVRCVSEIGPDLVKVPYCGDKVAHSQIVADCPLPMVAAGGPKTATLEDALAMMRDVIDSGVRGATIGRNIWGGGDNVTQAVQAFKAVIHDGASAKEALQVMG